MSWREILPVHPAAELFPMMAEDELRALGTDIKRHGLKSPIIVWAAGTQEGEDHDWSLLDGRNRLDAMETVGLETITLDGRGYPTLRGQGMGPGRQPVERKYQLLASFYAGEDPEKTHSKPSTDPWEYALSANVHRRHLTPSQRRDVIAALLKAKPGRSNNQTAKLVGASDKTVASVRNNLESTSEIPKLTETIGADKKARPTRRKPKLPPHPGAVKRQGAEHGWAMIVQRLSYLDPEDFTEAERVEIAVVLRSSASRFDLPELEPGKLFEAQAKMRSRIGRERHGRGPR